MGLWWKRVTEIPGRKARAAGSRNLQYVRYFGDASAWPKKWYVFGLWRLQNRWHVIKVQCDDGPYTICFDDGVDTMVCRRAVGTPYVAVRVGQRDVTFYAVSMQSGYRCFMKDMGPFDRTNSRFSDRDDIVYRDISLREWAHHITTV